MDFKPKILRPFPGHPAEGGIPMPFYMTYPGYSRAEQESALLQDMEYLQRAYPNEVKGYQHRVAQILDKMDYEGSMIYDEYPDFYSLRQMTDSIVKILQNEEKEMPKERQTPVEKWVWLNDLIQVLLCNEIYKRRHGGRRGNMGWLN